MTYQSINNLPESALQIRRILSTPEIPSGTSLEERNKSKSSRVPSRPFKQPERNIQIQDNLLNQTQQQSVIVDEVSDRRDVINDGFHDEKIPALERLDPRPVQRHRSNMRDNRLVQTRPSKPLNNSRINSTIKLVRPFVQPKVSYSAVVKGTTSIMRAPNTIYYAYGQS